MAYPLLLLLLPAALGLAALLLALLHYLGALRRRRPGEPPLDRGPLPWLGHVLAFRRDTARFLRRMRARHGDIFTVQLGGRYFTFLMDPLSYGAVVKASRAQLDFEAFAVELVSRVFGYQAGEQDHRLLVAASSKYLMGDGLDEMTRAMMGNLQTLLLPGPAGAGRWVEAELFHFCYNVIFRAGYLTLFGTEPAAGAGDQEAARQLDLQHSERLFGHFRRYDRLFPRLAYAVLPPRERLEAERLKRLWWDLLAVGRLAARERVSAWVAERQRQMAEQGVGAGMQGRYMFLLLWASQSNTGPSAFWLLAHLLGSPEALRAVRAEVDGLLRETGQAAAGGPPVRLTRDMLRRTPVLDSAVDESLRLTVAPVLTRAVLEDGGLRLADGREYGLRRGDRLALFPYLSAQTDPEVHPEPHTFRYDRFLQPGGGDGDGPVRKTDFYKDGKRLKYYNMPWGAGVSMCPGRFFAVNELKQFVFLMISYFDFELLNPEEGVPPIDCSRWGFGSMQPTRDVRFRYRLRF
ncbi:7-alpha-hydroxycholest-4-en-3-one 12-alpha-hydroxylase [Cetorhinus maximus]